MTEPVSPAAVTVTVAAGGAPVVLAATLLNPNLAEYGIVAMSAFAAALVQLSAQCGLTRTQGALLVFRILMVSLALTGAVSWMVLSVVTQYLAAAMPVSFALSIVSFALGLADGNWKAIGSSIGDWILRLLPERRT